MFPIAAVIVIALLVGFMSLTTKTTTTLAKVGQGAVTIALIVGAAVVYFLFLSPSSREESVQTQTPSIPPTLTPETHTNDRGHVGGGACACTDKGAGKATR